MIAYACHLLEQYRCCPAPAVRLLNRRKLVNEKSDFLKSCGSFTVSPSLLFLYLYKPCNHFINRSSLPQGRSSLPFFPLFNTSSFLYPSLLAPPPLSQFYIHSIQTHFHLSFFIGLHGLSAWAAKTLKVLIMQQAHKLLYPPDSLINQMTAPMFLLYQHSIGNINKTWRDYYGQYSLIAVVEVVMWIVH